MLTTEDTLVGEPFHEQVKILYARVRLDGRQPSRIAELPDRFRFFPVLRSVYSTSLHCMARPVFA